MISRRFLLISSSSSVLYKSVARSLGLQRSISTCSVWFNNKKEEVEDEIEQNPYFEKYADKIKKVQNEAEQYNVKKPTREDSRLRRETEQWKDSIKLVEERLTQKKKEQEDKRGSKLPSTLGELIHLEMLESKSADEIAQIWTENFKDKEAISAVIPVESYEELSKRAQEFPTFLFPLPKDKGYEFVLSQFEGNRCFFTSLINFQVHGENAPWQFCMTFYSEMKDTKGIVLMTSEVDQTTMNIFEAQCLAQLQKLFYIAPDEKKADLLFTFNRNPDAFKYMLLIKELEGSDMIVKKSD